MYRTTDNEVDMSVTITKVPGVTYVPGNVVVFVEYKNKTWVHKGSPIVDDIDANTVKITVNDIALAPINKWVPFNVYGVRIGTYFYATEAEALAVNTATSASEVDLDGAVNKLKMVLFEDTAGCTDGKSYDILARSSIQRIVDTTIIEQ